MKRCLGVMTLIAVAGLCVCASAQDAAKTQEWDTALAAITGYEWGQSREPLTKVSDMVVATVDVPGERAALAAKLASLLEGDATYACKQFVCRQLSLIGTENEVPVLAALLTEEKISDMARYALERMPSPAVDNALLEKLPEADGVMKVGIINSLGARETRDATGALADLASASDAAAREAAIAALGKIGGEQAADALSVLAKKDGPTAAAAADAYLLCADTFLEDGKKRAARAIYEDVYNSEMDRRLRVAAMRGLVAVQGDDAVPLILAGLSDDDPQMRAVSAGFIREMAGKSVAQAFASRIGECPPDAKALVIAALGDRGDEAALDEIAEVVKSGQGDVRLAALEAVGKLGDESVVELLAGVAAHGTEEEQEAAAASLYRLSGEYVNTTMTSLLDGVPPDMQKVLIEALHGRGASASSGALIAVAQEENEEVAESALKALADLASPKQLPQVVALLANAEKPELLNAARRTVVAVASRADDPAMGDDALLKAYEQASRVPVKKAMLGAMSEIGAPSSLPVVMAATKSQDAEIKDAAIRALAQWPAAEPLEELLLLAEETDSVKYKVIALRGALRMLALPSDRTGEQVLAIYKQAMDLAPGPDEKKMVLSGLANVGSKGVIDMIRPYLDDPQLKAEAEQAIDQIKARQYKPTASHNAEKAGNALDRNPDTRWDTGTPMKGGEWFQVDLGWDDTKVKKVVLDTQKSSGDYPRAYEVYIGNDPDNLGEPVAKGTSDSPITEIEIEPTAGRYLRIVQTGKSNGLFWSIHELRIETEE